MKGPEEGRGVIGGNSDLGFSHRRPEEVLAGPRRARTLEVVNGSKEHVGVTPADNRLEHVEFTAPSIAAHASTVAPVLLRADYLQ